MVMRHLFLAVASCFVVMACTPQESGGDGGVDAGVIADAGTDAGVDAGTDAGVDGGDGCPAYTGTDPWCLGRIKRCHRCVIENNIRACEKANIATCETDGKNYSPEILTVLGACEDEFGCGSDGQAFGICVRSARDAMPLTAARQALASAFCAKCDASNTLCVDTFFDTSAGDRGALLADMKDSVVTAVKTHCVDPANADCNGLVLCAYPYLPDELPRVDVCKSDGGP
ncbi:MAG: hypothetical protein K1X64_08510 [Myxococcaceae bacterium]|nr:hypothetical protein [Myxococcaceae bacterium]